MDFRQLTKHRKHTVYKKEATVLLILWQVAMKSVMFDGCSTEILKKKFLNFCKVYIIDNCWVLAKVRITLWNLV